MSRANQPAHIQSTQAAALTEQIDFDGDSLSCYEMNYGEIVGDVLMTEDPDPRVSEIRPEDEDSTKIITKHINTGSSTVMNDNDAQAVQIGEASSQGTIASHNSSDTLTSVPPTLFLYFMV